MTSDFDDIISAAKRMNGFARPWFVSGGWAIDLFLGRVTRVHGDLEIGIFRSDQLALQTHFADQALFKVITHDDGGEWVAWEQGEFLELPIHQLLVRAPGKTAPSTEEDREPGEVEFFLNESSDGLWQCRRNLEITRPADEIVQTSPISIPILASEIQLLFKAKYCREKDERDFQNAMPLLDESQRAWLKDSLRRCYTEHKWIEKL